MELTYAYNEYVRFNVDDRIRIKLTAKGRHHLAQLRTAAVLDRVPFRAVTSEDIDRLEDQEGYISIRMIDFMIAFGSIISAQDGPQYFDPFIRIKSLSLNS
jgi:hypothetical protein